MLRRIVLVRHHESLQAGWDQRSFGPSGSHLDSALKTKGVRFEPANFPVPAFGRRAPVAATARRGVSYYGLSPSSTKASPAFGVVAHFDDQESIERLKKDNGQDVIGVYADPRMLPTPAAYCQSQPVGAYTDVAKALGVPKLQKAKLTGKNVRVAIVDTGIHGDHAGPDGKPIMTRIKGGYSPRPGYMPGSNPIDHATMVAFDVLISAPDARLLDYALLQSTQNAWEGFLSDALAAFANLIDVLQGEPGPLVVNNSWGLFDRREDAPVGSPENYSANPDHPFNQIVGALVSAGADVFFAAGNCGQDCPDGRCGAHDIGRGASIHGANSHPSVITVAAVTTKKMRLGYSSQGPGGLYMRKPDLSAFSHFSGSKVYKADGGTSAACPVAVGVAAALRQGYRQLPPAELKGVLQRNTEPLGAGWNYDTGYGIISAERSLLALQKSKAARPEPRPPRSRDLGVAWMQRPVIHES